MLGTPLGHLDFVKAQLRAKAEEHGILLNRVEAFPDLQCAWLILSFCCVTRANDHFRTIHREGSEDFAGAHDTAIRSAFNSLLDIQEDQDAFNLASLLCRLGGVGFPNAVRGALAAYWSSWVDSLRMIRKRHLDISDFITVALGRGGSGPPTEAAARSREALVELGFDAAEWSDLAKGLRPEFDPADRADTDGNRRLPTLWRTTSWSGRSGPQSHTLSMLSSVPSRDRWQVSLSPVCLFQQKRHSSLKSSGSCSFVASGNFCSYLRSPARVADHSTHVAIIAQRVRWQEIGAPGIRV